MDDKELHAFVEASETGDLAPPRDLHDPGAWDQYWFSHLGFGAFEQRIADGFNSDETLVGLLNDRSTSTILCLGNGLSEEAVSLALHGFDVTSLDISQVPSLTFLQLFGRPEFPPSRVPGLHHRDDGSISFGAPGPLDPTCCLQMHRSDDHPPRTGGSISWIVGDLFNPELCVGPFDAIIERRTLQLFSRAELPMAFDRVEARLAVKGTLVSHEHDADWSPARSPSHFATKWFTSRGFVISENATPKQRKSAERLAQLVISSG